ncbi:MAG: peptidylprolyl isomerase [Prolixibacteraceae bacterium]|nr:peptidylprolyl isomerase [Prolixibacteraceae bacterium]
MKIKQGILILISALFTTFSTIAQDKVIDQVVAVVGGNIILKSDVENNYLQAQAQGMTTEGDMKCELLENLLVDKLLLAEAELDTLIDATPSQINQQLESTIQMYISRLGGEKQVEEYFGKPVAVLKSEMQEPIRNQILTQQMQAKIVENVTATPAEVRAYFRKLKEEEVPEVPTQYEYQQITMIPLIDISEDNRVKAQLRDLKQRIENGASFGSLAMFYSEGPSASNGGELPYYGRAELDPNYASVAFNLKKDQISNVVRSEMGYHIIQLMDRKGEKVKTRHILMQPKVSPEAREHTITQLDSLAKIIRKGDLPFEDAAILFSSDKNSRNNGGLVINPYTMSSKFPVVDLPADVSKVITGLKLNEISDPFESIDESQRVVYKIIKLVNKIDGHKADLQNDYQQIAEVFLAEKKEDTLKDWIRKHQDNTFIRIDATYANCNFNFDNWIK